MMSFDNLGVRLCMLFSQTSGTGRYHEVTCKGAPGRHEQAIYILIVML